MTAITEQQSQAYQQPVTPSADYSPADDYEKVYRVFVARIVVATILGALAGAAIGFAVGGPVGLTLGIFIGAGFGYCAGTVVSCKIDDAREEKLEEAAAKASRRFQPTTGQI